MCIHVGTGQGIGLALQTDVCISISYFAIKLLKSYYTIIEIPETGGVGEARVCTIVQYCIGLVCVNNVTINSYNSYMCDLKG